ncbi:tripartite tricarboxylate transporter TctB family protein [Acidaminococcus timonensis]|uniref:tripartite tricarboxylate transporter TctB family protein n=1 Tax=Acidaminococcus timonensis TaxID=1871002 RepID=UPI003079AA90
MKINGDIGIGIILLIIEAVFYAVSFEFINPAAAQWPRGVLIVSAVLSVFLIIQGIRDKDAYVAPEFKSIKAPLLALLVMVVYCTVMDLAGFFISTIIFCPLGMYLMGQRNLKALIAVPIGLDLFVYVLFVTQLQLQMP